MNPAVEKIFHAVAAKRGVDFSIYDPAFLAQQLQKRVAATAAQNYQEYARILTERPEEFLLLIDTLLIKFSLFFRDPLIFEILASILLPQLAQEKIAAHNQTLRIWSAGCAIGEEPYSLAIVCREWLEQTEAPWNVHIFATDIRADALASAKRAVYSEETLRNVKYGFCQKYFQRRGNTFQVRPEVQNMVSFSVYDLLDKKLAVPSESIFGDFDLVFCRNVLMYLNEDAYAAGLQKLIQALSKTGILVLGEAESLPKAYQSKLAAVFPFCKIYRKRERPEAWG